MSATPTTQLAPAAQASRPAPAAEPAAQSGIDVGAWFDAHASFVGRTVQRLAGLSSPVDDIVQEVFVIAVRKRQRIDPAVEPRGWLYRTAVNLIWHHRRSLARRLAAEQRLANQPSTPPRAVDEDLVQAEQARMVRQCVGRLPINQREVFVLFEFEGLQGADVARMLEIPVNTVWSRLHHGRKRFRQLWEHARADWRCR